MRYRLLWVFLLVLTACQAPTRPPQAIRVTIQADGETHTVQVPAGTTAKEAVALAGITLEPLDRLEPAGYTVLTDGAQVRVVRVQEVFETQEEVIPFERQTVRNEALPEGETRVVQQGVNGRKRVTYRLVYEDGQLTARQVVNEEILQEAVPEIVMVGVRSPFTPEPIPGRLAYLNAGNAWIMEGDTGQRRPVVLTGDLDGRIFRLSPDRRWLLFTRHSTEPDRINELWLADLQADPVRLLDLGIANVIHFADFSPKQPKVIAYSSVEPREAPPGWQANNELALIQIAPVSGKVLGPKIFLEPNAGGVYGWWGTVFAWRPDAQGLALAQPDGVGYLKLGEEQPERWIAFTPYRTRADWAWVPGISWSPQGDVLFTVSHGLPGYTGGDEADPTFHLIAYSTLLQQAFVLVEDVGMFAYPVASPLLPHVDNGSGYWVAYLQAITPHQSELSRYVLMVMDRDGSDRRRLYPTEPGDLGLEPQEVVWSPEPLPQSGNPALAFLHEGNVYLIDARTGKVRQLTGDGQTSRLAWR
ncbi:MAG: DUF348 domain-containing protein [Chloroflexi bacterium]|nr:DUF348 domain-containing protein [Chloroflexota bacterium]